MIPKLTVTGIRQLFKLQVAVMLVLVIISMMLGGFLAAWSVLAGSLVFLIPNAVFVRQVFKYKGASSAKQIVGAFYRGEGLKIVLSIFLFALVFSLFKMLALLFFGAYLAMQLLLWLAPAVIK